MSESVSAQAKPREISCEQCRELLSDYVDRELSADEQAAVELHLSTCLRCGNESSRIAGLKKFVQHWEGVRSSDNFRQAVMEQFVKESRVMPSAPFNEAAEKARTSPALDSQVQYSPDGESEKGSVGWYLAMALAVAVLAYYLVRYL